ncbi:MAG TPA: prolipoprotein diacylglyceryl transferase [Blastocatellia bacterium]|nr:prolipoprotein diacylglyceryl transferase [Blastocatellia bacterium]
MFPELFRIPSLELAVSTYSAALAIAFITTLTLAIRLAKREGLPEDRVRRFGIYLLPIALLGVRILDVLIMWPSADGSWYRWLSANVIHSGGQYLGGFLAALGASMILARAWQLSWPQMADVFAPGLALGNVIGRLGCFAGGCCWGQPTTSWMGVQFSERAQEINGVPANVALLPTQLIEASANLAIFVFLLGLWKRKAFNGQIILVHMILYSLERFIVEFWRADPRGQIMGFSTAQSISVIILPLSFLSYCWLGKRMTRNSAVSDSCGV